MLRPHILAIDDAPFDKRQSEPVPLVAVLTEGHDLVEAVAVSSFPVDGAAATEFLAGWVGSLRCFPSVDLIVLGGITVAGLGLVDVAALADELDRPVLVVNRRDPSASRLESALRAAGLTDRIAEARRCPPAERVDDGLHLAVAGIEHTRAVTLLEASRGKAHLPEALRLAHLIAAAIVSGQSQGRA
jgi:endonuclease V-like protein UPF0215 family